MKKSFCLLFTLTLLLSVPCCTEQESENDEILAKINDYELTNEEFESLLVSDLEFDPDFKLTKEARELFLDQLIQQELFIQEAKRLRLDTKEKFIKTIERYWEATLIKELMDLKGKELYRSTYVTQEEVGVRYVEMKKRNDTIPPFEMIAKEIAQNLKEEKKQKKLKEWINTLKKTAKIEINEEQLSKN